MIRRLPWQVLLPILTLGLAAAIVLWVLRGADESASGERIGFQDSDRPLDDSAAGEPDPRLRFPTAWTLARIPLATRFDPPLGSEHAALSRRVHAFGEQSAEENPDSRSAADALTIIGMDHAALGESVYAVADGLVLRAAPAEGGWGNVVMLGHRLEDGEFVQSVYACLHRIAVAPGTLIARGAVVGELGRGEGGDLPQLHFEIRAGAYPDLGPRTMPPAHNRLDPAAFIAERRGAPDDMLSPSPLAVPATVEPWTTIEIRGAEKAPALLKTPEPAPTNDN